jgi:type IV pilus assembly protein PilB
MSKAAKGLILSIDDDQEVLDLIERLLTTNGFRVMTADSGLKGLEAINKAKPRLILLDVRMPGMDGYAVCSRLQENSKTAYIPVIFVTALGEDQDKARAFSVGAVDYLVKPIQKDILLESVRKHLKTGSRWKDLQKGAVKWYEMISPADFIQFKEFLFAQLDLSPEQKYECSGIIPSKIYEICSAIGINERKMAQYIAEFLKLPHVSPIEPESIQLGVLPTPFCKSNHVAAINDESGEKAFVLSNPFDWERLEDLRKFAGKDEAWRLFISEPNSIEMLFRYEALTAGGRISKAEDKLKIIETPKEVTEKISEWTIERAPIVYLSNNILEKALSEQASDIRIEPKEAQTVVRFRVNGDLMDFFTLKKDTAVKVISRLKLFADMDIGERRKPQDGAFAAIIGNKTISFRLATTSTPYGESLVIRILDIYSEPKDLNILGMTDEQLNIMVRMGNQSGGLILIVGPTGSGKTTTIYSLLHKIDCQTRSLITIEDPVEYRMSFANQQQVNEKAGVTFEALLKSVVRQDPDIMFMGEVRDPYSAKVSMEFSSTGHMTISSLHTSNATTAIFRLERLGVDRGAMADTILAVVAQRLLKKLCPHCKEIVPISEEETRMLSPFAHVMPSQVAHSVGCLQCNNTGYSGREGVYEILEFDAEISEMIRANVPIAEIRSSAQERGNYLISHHAVEKVKDLIFTPKDVYEGVLVEEVKIERFEPELITPKAAPAPEAAAQASILVAEDEEDTRKLIVRFLEGQGHEVTASKDGVDALLHLGKKHFDLILSDIRMPNLDGFKLLEMISQKGIDAPVIFLTAMTRAEEEQKGIELGAMDYIKKPIRKETFLSRVQKALEMISK